MADERARRDETIGRASADGITVAADEGLAHVRDAGPGRRLRLWAQAPVVSLQIDRQGPAAAAPLAITFDNVLVDAALLDEAGQPLPGDAGDDPLPTRRRFVLGPATAAGPQRLHLAPAGRRQPGAASGWRCSPTCRSASTTSGTSMPG